MTGLRDMSSFGELAKLLDDLPVIVLNARRSRHMSQRAVATETGLSFSTVAVDRGDSRCLIFTPVSPPS